MSAPSFKPTLSPTLSMVGNTLNLQTKYEYILALGVLGAFGFGFGTGANDVANAFGTSVGSGALSNRSAMFIAGIFEFLGALVLGRVSTDTIAGKIAIPAAFSPIGGYYCYDNRYCGVFARGRRCADQFVNGKLDTKTYWSGCQGDSACSVSGAVRYTGTEACRQDDRTGQLFFEPGNPMAFAYGMMWTLLIGTVWLAWATYVGYNVSSTHSIIGGIIGFALAYNKDAVNWIFYEDPLSGCATSATACDKSAFPYSGIVPIVVAWFFAPIATATMSALFFTTIRTFVLRSEHSFERSFWLLPIFVFLTMFICIYFVFTKGAAKTFNSDPNAGWSDQKSGWVAVVIAAGCAIIAACCLPLLKRRAQDMIEMEVAQAQAYEQRKLQIKERRESQQMAMAEGGKVVPDGVSDRPRLYVPVPPSGEPPFGKNSDADTIPAPTGTSIQEGKEMGAYIQNNKEMQEITYGWEQRIDPNTGNPIYMKLATGQTTSYRPCGGWEEMIDPVTGNKYWGNVLTGQSSWTIPSAMGGQMIDNDAITVTDEVLTPRQLASKKEAKRIANIQAAYLRSPEGWKLCQEDCKNPDVGCWRTCMNCNERSMEQDRQYMHEYVMDIDDVAAVEDNAEQFDQRTEASFKILQIFSACCVMFAHGSGEVGYMAGPLSTIWVAYNNPLKKPLPSNGSAEYWILVLSAASLVCGLAIFGKRVTRVVGKEIAKVSAARGFAAELSTAIVIMIAAQYGLPTSSSQCITGGIVGIGIVEGVQKGVNWKQFGLQFMSWVLTIFVMALGTAAFFKQGLEAPTRYALKNTQYDQRM